ncbi:type II toxin-antitoxin system death-on-curing family toxin [Arsenicitalea aurantiaca]|uniref:Type II toxin-antitoxin system death-on-curing family toxin n=1 Tax=Arsenicitalea aurantiaca TaxID=1783274 RepID=A0A433X8J2_9HYPH|nr:Fic family protein [Arsenicitalea aurantiaca]RUT30372.1 type II toxin-antitoxin system death-on-curing family toxin [Arsenicitalea aurantiaca]
MVAYLSLKDALHIHSEQIRLFGGEPGVRDMGLVEAALLRPQTGHYADLLEEAAALWESLTLGRGFVDANKRVAFACVDVFLGLNDAVLEADDYMVVAFIDQHLDAGTFSKSVLEEWLLRHVRLIR